MAEEEKQKIETVDEYAEVPGKNVEIDEAEEVVETVSAEDKIKNARDKERRARRGELTQNEIVSAWSPKTKLGEDVKNKKIKSINEILDNDKKILEPEIVDALLHIKTDLISIGQAKGKFGGGKRRAWRQTQRKTKEGNVMTFSAMAVAGDSNGHIGIGVGKSKETLPARDKATRKAKLNVIKVTRGCSAFDCACSDLHSVPFEVTGKAGSVSVTLIPAPQGTGLVVAKELKKVLKLVGIHDVYSKTFGKQRTTFNLVQACMKALEKTNERNKK
jgi:small subunit ribosomal protein S5